MSGYSAGTNAISTYVRRMSNDKLLTCPQCGGDRWIETATRVESAVGRFVLDDGESRQVEEERPLQRSRTAGLIFHCMTCGLALRPDDEE